jgi:RHS repeat-associated protein
MLPAAVPSAMYDAANRLVDRAGHILSYDQNGNLANDGLATYSWNARNQLASVSGASSATFQYDATKRRTAKTIDGQATQFLYDGADIVQELSGTTPTATVIRGLSVDELWSRTDALGTHVTLADALGSMLAETDTSGLIQTQFGYEPFGNTTSTGTFTATAFEYTGREHDTDDLYFYRARFYSPTEGRFLSEDPIEFRGGLNLYAYVADNPLNLIDPSGECSCSVRVRCRAVNHWTAYLGAEHCYIVVKDRDGQYTTLTGGPQNGRLWAWKDPGDPDPGNSFKDQTVFFREGTALCNNVECLKQKVQWLRSLDLGYIPNNQNSNSFVSWAMELCGLPVRLPFRAYGRE